MTRSRKQPRILVLHGPNLNLLGEREPAVYGSTRLDEINRELAGRARNAGAELEAFQSNIEGELVDRIQQARGAFDALVINAAAYTHTSVAIRDAVRAVGLPAIEVHLSNLHKRGESEPFRLQSLIAPVCVGTLAGFGPLSYYLALDAALSLVGAESQP